MNEIKIHIQLTEPDLSRIPYHAQKFALVETRKVSVYMTALDHKQKHGDCDTKQQTQKGNDGEEDNRD